MNSTLEQIGAAIAQATPAPQSKPVQEPRPTEAAVQAQAHVTREAVDAAIREANQALEASSTSIRFSTDPDTNGIVVRVTDEATGKVVRQIPTQEQLAISSRLRELVGVLLNREG